MHGSFHVGEWLVEPQLNLITRDDATVHLRPRVMDLLICLAQHPGEVLSKQTLLGQVWNADFVSESALTTAVTELRQAFGDRAEHPRIIATVAKRGYRLIAPVRAAPVVSAPVTSTALVDQRPRVGSARRPLPGFLLLVVALTALVMALAMYARPDHGVVQSIAVLPFEELSEDPTRAWYGDALAEALITELSAIDRFDKVINRADRYRGTTSPLVEVARELDVDALVTGTVMIATDRLVVHIRVVDGRSERPLWAAQFEGKLGDLALQREIVQYISRELRVQLPSRWGAPTRPPERIELAAYEAYWRARASFSAFTPGSRQLALQHIERAVSRAPGFALAHAAKAEFYGELILAGGITDAEALARGSAAALTALNIDPDAAEAHSANARLLLLSAYDWQGADRAHRRAIRLKGNSAPVRAAYGHYLALAGRYDEAIAEMRRATMLDPTSFFPAGLLAWGYLHARRYEESIAQWERAFELTPGTPAGRDILARAYAAAGRESDALALCDHGRSVELSCAPVYALVGRAGLARSILDRMPDDRVGLTRIETHALLGDAADVLRLLDRAVANRNAAALFLNGPAFERVRYDPGFQALRKRLGYPSP